MSASEESRNPGSEGEKAGIGKNHRCGNAEDRRPPHSQLDKNIAKGQLGLFTIRISQNAAPERLANGQTQGREKKSRNSNNHKSEPPSRHRSENRESHGREVRNCVNYRSTDQESESGADEDTHRVDAQRESQLLLGKVIRNDRERGRRQGCFTDPHSDSRGEQARKASGGAAQTCHDAPRCHATDHDVAAIARVHQPSDGQTHEGIKNGEGEAGKQTKAGVAKTEVAFDWTNQEAEDLSVDECERVTDNQDKYDVLGICGSRMVVRLRRKARIADSSFHRFRSFYPFRDS